MTDITLHECQLPRWWLRSKGVDPTSQEAIKELFQNLTAEEVALRKKQLFEGLTAEQQERKVSEIFQDHE